MADSEPAVVRVLTVSATYGAGGSVVAPRLAERLGLPFFDRLIYRVGAEPNASIESIEEHLTAEEKKQSPPGRIMANLSRMSTGLGIPNLDPADLDPINDLRFKVETSVTSAAATGGVILGRGAAVVLGPRPGAFHVRLSGPREQRVQQGMAIERVTEREARTHQADADRAWAKFVERLFARDPADPTLYHLVLDSTAITLDDCVDVIARTAERFWAR